MSSKIETFPLAKKVSDVLNKWTHFKTLSSFSLESYNKTCFPYKLNVPICIKALYLDGILVIPAHSYIVNCPPPLIYEESSYSKFLPSSSLAPKSGSMLIKISIYNYLLLILILNEPCFLFVYYNQIMFYHLLIICPQKLDAIDQSEYFLFLILVI